MNKTRKGEVRIKRDLNEPAVFLDPLTEVGDALAARWNEIEGYQKYTYDEETATICSETETGFQYSNVPHGSYGVATGKTEKGRSVVTMGNDASNSTQSDMD
jgi:hypothetical protein